MRRSGVGGHFRSLYRFLENGRICVYCGVRASSIDHFVPLSVVYAISDVLSVVSGRVLVPACGECNSIAGSHVFKTIAAKRRYIQEKLAKKYARILNLPEWDDDEIDELGWSLRSKIMEGRVKKEWLKQRLAWRNTSNPAAVEIAKIRLRLGAGGRGFVQNAVRTHGMLAPKWLTPSDGKLI